MKRLVLTLLCGLACAPALTLCAPASADVFETINLASIRPLQVGSTTLSEQAEEADEPAISGDGDYVAFVGQFGGVRGIWRRDLLTGAVEQVAPSPGTSAGGGQGLALLPSISADGRYVSFTTGERLNPAEDHNEAPDVYVRDMSKPCTTQAGACLPCSENPDAAEQEACPFTLVSAVNGSSLGTSYFAEGGANDPVRYGSLASGRSAMSASGRYVVFETTAESELLGAGARVPAREVFVRDLATEETKLVSDEYEPSDNAPKIEAGEDVPVQPSRGFGAAYLGSELPPFPKVLYGGASISADGSTVAWMGQEIGRQARLLPGQQASYLASLDEPLWRRILDGPLAPTLRVTGGSDPYNPLCAAGGGTMPGGPAALSNPCQGPFAESGNPEQDYLLARINVDSAPQLSADGDVVAFLASEPEVSEGRGIEAAEENSDDLYVANMAEGLTRVQALKRLTRISGEPPELEAPIVDLALSPDGSQVAFTAKRTQFPGGSPTYVSAPAAQLGIVELFDADLANDTLTRVTHGYVSENERGEDQRGGVGEIGAAWPSFSEDGNTLSFSSEADNLVYGDANNAADVFVVHRRLFPTVTPEQHISSPPPGPSLTPEWRLGAVASPERDGVVVLYAEVPGAGTLAASAQALVAAGSSSQARRARSSGHSSHRAARASATATVARAQADVGVGNQGLVPLSLRLGSPYSELAARAGGLYATVTVTFAAAGHPTLHMTLHVSFLRAAIHSKASRASKAARRRGHGRHVR